MRSFNVVKKISKVDSIKSYTYTYLVKIIFHDRDMLIFSNACIYPH